MIAIEPLLARPPSPPPTAATATLADIRKLVGAELPQQVRAIDEGTYPREFLQHLGAAGGYSLHTGADVDLASAIEAMANVSEHCLSTGFMTWCQDTLVWYVLNSDNEALKVKFLDDVASGRRLGGTGLSNPMKGLYGIEAIRLKGRRVEGGYVVKGSLPWVSNLGPDHLFGTIFETEQGATRVMCLIDCAQDAVVLKPCPPFLAMDGTGTYAVHLRDLFIPDDMILADPATAYVEKIRAGFVLLQTGMALGLVRDCIRMMEDVRPMLGHVNEYLETQPEDVAAALDMATAEIIDLARTPYDTSTDYWRRVLAVRLAGGEASVQAAHNAMLHCGARGYVMANRCQRRLREAYFVAIVTPATKQLRLMLAKLAA